MADSKTRRTVRPRLVYTHILENIDIVKGLACAHDHGGKRIVDNSDGQIGLVAQKLIEALQERAAAGEHASSGGVCSRAMRTAWTMLSTCSAMDLRISSEVMVMFFGMPSRRSRPLISRVSSGSRG